VIFEKQGEYEIALEEFNRFLALSSIAEHANRKEYARGRIREIQGAIDRRRIEERGASRKSGAASGG
jgi:hypothetical protein